MNAVVSVYLYTTKEFLFWIARQVSLVFEYEFFSQETHKWRRQAFDNICAKSSATHRPEEGFWIGCCSKYQ